MESVMFPFLASCFFVLMASPFVWGNEYKSLGLLAPHRLDMEMRDLRYQITMYETADSKESLGACEVDGYFRPLKARAGTVGKNNTISCLVRWPFVVIETGITYRGVEFVSYEQKNGRHKVMLSGFGPHSYNNNQPYRYPDYVRWDNFLWIEIGPQLSFSDYRERILENADGFTEYWDRKLYLAPDGNGQYEVIPGSLLYLSRFLFFFGKTPVVRNGQTWLQINSIDDMGAACGGRPQTNLPYTGLWVPLLNERGKYNVRAFSFPRGC